MGKLVKSRQNANRLISGKTSACRNTGGRVDQAAQRAGNEGVRMRQALVAGVVNGVSGEAWAETANLIYHQGRISGCSGILFEKKIQRNTRAAGNALKREQKISNYCIFNRQNDMVIIKSTYEKKESIWYIVAERAALKHLTR